jgi:hypothetical protein
MDACRTFATAIYVILVGATSSPRVLGQIAPAAERSVANSDGDSQPLFSETTVDQSPWAGRCDVGLDPSCCCPLWTASAEFITLERVGTVNQTLVTTYPGAPNPAGQYIVGQGTDQFHSSDLTQGFAGGPKVSLLRHGDSGCDVEFSFFEIDGWNNAASVASGANTTPIFVAPGAPLEFARPQRRRPHGLGPFRL